MKLSDLPQYTREIQTENMVNADFILMSEQADTLIEYGKQNKVSRIYRQDAIGQGQI